MIENVYNYQENLKKDGVYFSVTGPFSHILMEGIADILKKKMALENIKMSTMMNVYSVVVEQVQNIIRYSAEVIPGEIMGEKNPEIRLGTLVVGYEDEHYFVVSGNQIRNSDAKRLRERLTALRNMTKDELKQHYKEQRRKDREPTSQGAGLGFIEIARKAERLEFDFHPINETVSFFSLRIIV